MTAPSTPTGPSETRAHTFAVGDRVVAAVDITEGMVYGTPFDDDVMVMQGTGGIVIPFDWYDAPILFNCHVLFDANEDGDCDSWYLNAAWLSPAAPVPPERDDDVVGAIVTALEAQLKQAKELAEKLGDGNGSRSDLHRAGRLDGKCSGLLLALDLVNDIAGRGVP